jgi:hypothetical protein
MLEIVWQTLYASVWDIVWDGVVRDFPKVDIAWLPVSESIAAYYDFEGLLFYQFFHETYEENDLIHFVLFNEMVSGYQLGEQEARLVRMPTRVERDEQGRLHCASGRCMQYRDGWGFYAWHGVKVPEKLILHPEQLTKEEWLTEENLEVRRAMQERLGPDRFIELVGARCIDQGRRGTLMEVDLGNDPERVAHYVQVRDASTERLYFLRVPPSIQRADEAVAWTFALQEQDYNPVQET